MTNDNRGIDGRVSMLAFPQELYQARIEWLQQSLQGSDLDGLLLFDPENMFWLTGYQTIGYFTFQAMFVPIAGRPVVISRVVNRELALAHPTIGGFEAIVDTAQPVDVLARFLATALKANARCGLETHAWYLTVKDYLALKERLSIELLSHERVIEARRIIKTGAEIDRMRQAARAAEAGLTAAIEAIAVGCSENDIAAAMFHGAIKSGSEYLGHPPLVVAGPTTALCFAMWRRRTIAAGDVVLLESAGCIDRYHAMLSRPVVVGSPGRAEREAANALQGVLEAALEAIRPGLSAGEVDARARAVVQRRGLGQYFKHRSAYGIGIGMPPNWSEGHIYAIRPDDPLVLEPNMTFHVIPSLFLEKFGMCFSDSVRVTENGCELLTNYPRKLFVADA